MGIKCGMCLIGRISVIGFTTHLYQISIIFKRERFFNLSLKYLPNKLNSFFYYKIIDSRKKLHYITVGGKSCFIEA